PEKLSWRSFKHGMLVCHQSFYARTDIARKVPYNLDYKLSADVDWCIRIMKEAEQQGLALWNTHMTLSSYLEGGMSVQSHRASLKERFNVMSDHYGKIATIGMHLWFVVRAILKR
ncbi:MAG: glycosyltransferase, partial [Prevotellaceae bacterium]|nr:glycosyltransferase [Prevotellaceae bacterium]